MKEADKKLPFTHSVKEIAFEIALSALDEELSYAAADCVQPEVQKRKEFLVNELHEAVECQIAVFKDFSERTYADHPHKDFGPLVGVFYWLSDDASDVYVAEEKLRILCYTVATEPDYFLTHKISDGEQRFLLDAALSNVIMFGDRNQNTRKIRQFYDLEHIPHIEGPVEEGHLYYRGMLKKLRERASPMPPAIGR